MFLGTDDMVGIDCPFSEALQGVGSPLPLRLLLIEETEDVQRIIQLGLELIAGLEVVSIPPSARWLELVHASAPSLILLDMFPNGSDILTTLCTTPQLRSIPVICIVSRDRAYDSLQATQQGATAIIGKPFDLYHLVDTIHKILGDSS